MTTTSFAHAADQICNGTWSDADVRAWLGSTGTPIIERNDPAGDTVQVTFICDAAADSTAPPEPERVELQTAVDRGITAERDLQQLGASPFWALTLTLPAQARFTYGFTVHARSGSEHEVHDVHRSSAPRRDPRLAEAVAELPDAEPLPWLEHAQHLQQTPALEEITFDSRLLGNSRSVWVSVPPSWSTYGGRFPFVVVFDGTADHTAPAVRDALSQAGVIRDCVVILLDPLTLRNQELTANPVFSRAIAIELLEQLRERFHLSDRPEDSALSGSSFGGLCAGYTALHHPETFGVAIMQSPSCWYTPRDQAEADLVGTEPVPVLIQEFLDARPAVLEQLRLYQECGIWEFGPRPARVWQVLGNRWLNQVLTLRGAHTVYREFAGGHDAAWWRGTWADALIWAFPPAES